jgi:hypothetical protein
MHEMKFKTTVDPSTRKTTDNPLADESLADSQEFVPLFGDWRDDVLYDSVAWALVESRKQLRKEYRDELTASIHKLELEVAELRGELKGIREDRRADVVTLPRSALRVRADARRT